MLPSEELRICLLGHWGFHGRTIAQTVKKYDGTEYSVGHIYETLKKNGITLRDYRDGIGDEAKSVIKDTDSRIKGSRKSRLPRRMAG